MLRVALAAAAVLVLAPSCAADPAPSSIDPDELVARIDAKESPFILDVRSAEEFASGHVPGATNVPHTELPARLAEIEVPPDAEVIVYCERGGRAQAAERALREAGFTNVRDLDGHMNAWRRDGRPCIGC